MTVNWSRREQADAARGRTVVAEMVHALHAATAPAAGSAQWWAALAEFAAVRAWCYRGLGLHAAAHRWQAVARDASAQVTAAGSQEEQP